MTLKFDDEKLRKPADPRRLPYITRTIKLEYQPRAGATYDLPGRDETAPSGPLPKLGLTRDPNGRKTSR
jgi:hypothetical protein